MSIKDVKIIVRNKATGSKLLKRNIEDYVKIEQYDSFLIFLEKSWKLLARAQVEINLGEIVIDQTVFDKLIHNRKLNIRKLEIAHHKIFQPCWVATIYKSDAPLYIYSKNPLEGSIKEFETILNDYGMVNGKPKYELTSQYSQNK